MKGGHHNYQWGKTPNALNTFCNDYVSFKEEAMRVEGLQKIFLNQKVFATEKLDGTNVGKDESGQMYGRRCLIGNLSEFYQKTSLKKVKQADIAKLKIDLCNEASIDQDKIQNFLVYGELMCNSIYDYKERDLVGEWRVFGAMIVAGEDSSVEVFEKLNEAGFAVSKELDEERIRIFPSTKLSSDWDWAWAWAWDWGWEMGRGKWKWENRNGKMEMGKWKIESTPIPSPRR